MNRHVADNYLCLFRARTETCYFFYKKNISIIVKYNNKQLKFKCFKKYFPIHAGRIKYHFNFMFKRTNLIIRQLLYDAIN